MSRSSLAPNYREVEAFGPDDEYETNEAGEIEEEVTYVTLDLGNIEPTLVPSSSTYRIIGLDTPTPFLQLSGTIFQGKHQALLGTELIFTETKDAQDSTKKVIAHVANTEQRIRFKEVELKPKGSTPPPPPAALRPPAKGKEKVDQPLDVMTGSASASIVPARRRGRKSKAMLESEAAVEADLALAVTQDDAEMKAQDEPHADSGSAAGMSIEPLPGPPEAMDESMG